MSEHNGLPRRRGVWIILKLATPYQLLLTMSVKLTQFVTHSLNARALSSVLAAYLPWVARTHSPRGGAVMSTSTHMSHVRRIRRWNHRGSIEAAQ